MQLQYPDGTVTPFKIFDATFEKNENNGNQTLITDQKSFLKIAVNDGFISINALQMAGKRKNTIEDFLRGNNVTDCKLIN